MDTPANFLITTRQKLNKPAGFILLFSLFINMFILTVPIYMMQIFDRVLASHSADTLIYLTVIALFNMVIFTLLEIIRHKIAVNAADWFGDQLTVKALGQSPDLILAGHAYSGQINKDIDLLKQFLSSNGLFNFFDLPWMSFYILLMYLLNPALGLIAFCGACLFIGFALLNHQATKTAEDQQRQQSAEVRKETATLLKSSEVIQAMGMMAEIINRWYNKNKTLQSYQSKSTHKTATIMSIAKGCRLSLQILILAVGALLVVFNQISPGTMIAASILMSRALAPVEGAIGTWKQFVASKDAYQRLFIFFEHEKNQPDNELIDYPAPVGNLKCEGLIYLPPNSTLPTIKQIAFEITAGETLAIIGLTGSSKSTLAKLIVGSLAPKSGSVRLDGVDLYHWPRIQIGQHIGYLPQELNLFNGTIKENITRLSQCDDALLIDAAKKADLYQDILQLKEGFDAYLGIDGVTLSMGQKQKLALARALYGNPKLVVLDEPVANLDLPGEAALQRTLKTLKQNGTTIILITHHPSLMKDVDKLLVLKQGNLLHFGEKNQVYELLRQSNTKEQQS